MTLKRALIGYKPSAVNAALEAIERYYREHTNVLPALVGLTNIPPYLRPLPLSLFGYRKDAVMAALADLHAHWHANLGRPMALAVPEAEGDHQTAPQSHEPAAVVEPQSVVVAEPPPVIEPPSVATAARVVPLRRRMQPAEEATTGEFPVRPASPQLWRPGAVEEMEGEPTAIALAPGKSRTADFAPLRLVAAKTGTAEPRALPVPLRQGASQAATQPWQPPAPQAQPTHVVHQPAAALVAEGLSERLETLFRRFLVGKVVGTDLLLPSGQLLVAKGVPITRELLDQAQEAGLLPTLIATMTIPGLD